MLKKIVLMVGLLMPTTVCFSTIQNDQSSQQEYNHELLMACLEEEMKKELSCSCRGVSQWFTILVPALVVAVGVIWHKEEFRASLRGEEYDEDDCDEK